MLQKRLFQFTPLREGRRGVHGADKPGQTHFNSRPSARGDRILHTKHNTRGLFQFTPLREGRRPMCTSAAARETFQFTPLREGRPSAASSSKKSPQISIHAPPRGATSPHRTAPSLPPISIHAPPRGATRRKEKQKQRFQFQFTPLREGRHLMHKQPMQSQYFNSRPSARGDLRVG